MGSPRNNGEPLILAPFVGASGRRGKVLFGPAVIVTILGFCLVLGGAFAVLAPAVIAPFALPLVVLSGVLVWALPDSPRPPSSLLAILLIAYGVVLVMWPNYLAFSLPGLPWITFTRLIGLPLVLVLLLSVSTSPEFRSRTLATLQATPLIWRLLLIFVGIQFVSIGFSHQIGYSVQQFIAYQIGWTAIFFASCAVFLRPGLAQLWAVALWIMAVGVSLIAVVETRGGHVPWAGHVPTFLRIQDPVVAAIMRGSSREAGAYRAQSTFTTPLTLAEYLVLSLPFIMRFIIGRYGWWVKLAAAASIPLLLYAILLTNSRLGVVGVLLSFLLYTLFWAVVRWRRYRHSLFGPAIALAYPVLFCAAMGATFLVGRLRALVWGNGPQNNSNQSRVEQIQKGVPMIFHHPWGYGTGMGAQALDLPDPISGIPQIDNYYLLIGLEYGLVGFVVFYGIIAAAIYYSGRMALLSDTADRDCNMLTPIAIGLVNFFVIKSIFSQQDNHPLVFMMLGMTAALTYRIAVETKTPNAQGSNPAGPPAHGPTPAPSLARRAHSSGPRTSRTGRSPAAARRRVGGSAETD